MGSKWGNARQADGFDGLGRQGHNGNDQPGPQAMPITKAELNPDNWTLHLEGGAGAARVVLDGKFENLPACAFVDRHLYARRSARHVQDYPTVLTSHFTNDKFPTAEIGSAAASPSFS